MNTLLDVDYTIRADTAFGAANTTTGSGGELKDGQGSLVKITTGELNVSYKANSNLAKKYAWYAGAGAALGQSIVAYLDNVQDADSLSLILRSVALPSWAGDFGGIGMTLSLRAAGVGPKFVSIWAISNATRGQGIIGPSQFQTLTGVVNGHNLRITLTATSYSPITVVYEIYDVTSSTVLKTLSVTAGPGGTYLTSSSDYGYLATSGIVAVMNDLNPGFNGGTTNPAQLSRLIVLEDPPFPPFVVDKPTLTSRTLSQNVLAAAESGGFSSYTRTWHAKRNDPVFTVPAQVLSGETAAALTHAHGDTITDWRMSARGLGPYWAYKTNSNDGNSTIESPFQMVPVRGPSTPAFIVPNRVLVLGRAGDSITGGPDDLDTGWSDYTNRLTSHWGIPSGNIVFRRTSQQGSALLLDWQPGSSPYPGGYADALLKHYLDRLEVAEAANSGCLVVAAFQLGTNDASAVTYSGETPSITAAQWVAGWQAVINEIQVTRGHTGWKIVIDSMPYSPNANVHGTPRGVRTWIQWRDALAALEATTNVFMGDFQCWYDFWVNVTSWYGADTIHPNSTGYTALYQDHADGLIYSGAISTPGAGGGGVSGLSALSGLPGIF